MLLSRTDKFDDHQDAAYTSGRGGAAAGAEGASDSEEEGEEEDVLLRAKLIKVQDPTAAGEGEGERKKRRHMQVYGVGRKR